MAAPVLARQLIQQGVAIHGGMRPYEFLNYYDFYYPPAQAGHVRIAPQVQVTPEGEYTLLIGVVAPSIEAVTRRPRSLTFSVDTSGSMSGLPIQVANEALLQIAGHLQAGDRVSIMGWSTTVEAILHDHTVSGPDDPQLIAAISQLNAGGSTDLHNGLVKAYAAAMDMYDEDRLNRVILISDGGANVGVTDEELIAQHADDALTEGIYLAGIGVDEWAQDYSDVLMDQITDAGKGAYVYLDGLDETGALLGNEARFLSIMEVAAREVQLSMTLPEGYVIDEFHGEEYSENPEDVEPQHLAPGDAMLFHQNLVDCSAELHDGGEVFEFAVTWIDPITREEMVDTQTMTMDEMIAAANLQLVKADAIVAYSKALTKVWNLSSTAERQALIDGVLDQINEAYVATGDADLAEIETLLQQYRDHVVL